MSLRMLKQGYPAEHRDNGNAINPEAATDKDMDWPYGPVPSRKMGGTVYRNVEEVNKG